ncbi:hypothetical protein [Streptomyces gossypiisoli]|uniref:hypothetical protein n=1 Tax=Streptomyces gossypiisoli TaxID=2748864 RepID=UPI0015DAE16F
MTFVSALLLTAAFLSLVPGRRTWFTVLGAGTICGYLLYGFLIKGAEYVGVFETHLWLHDPAGKVVLSLATAAAVTLMCAPPVRRALRSVTEPELSWTFRVDPVHDRGTPPTVHSPGAAPRVREAATRNGLNTL